MQARYRCFSIANGVYDAENALADVK